MNVEIEDRIKTFFICCKPTAGIPWSADIVLNDTRVSDAGIYRCMVNNPPETADPGIGELELSVLGTCVTCGPILSEQAGSNKLFTHLKQSSFNLLWIKDTFFFNLILIFDVFPTMSAFTGVYFVVVQKEGTNRLYLSTANVNLSTANVSMLTRFTKMVKTVNINCYTC